MRKMATARAVYTDLQLNFVLGAQTSPNTTQVPLIIIQLYKDGYAAAYGPGTYKVYDAAAEDPIIDTEECKSIIIADMTDLTNKWADSFKPNSTTKSPKLKLSDDAADEIANLEGPTIFFTSREDEDLQEVGDSII